jgi:ice-binding like protein
VNQHTLRGAHARVRSTRRRHINRLTGSALAAIALGVPFVAAAPAGAVATSPPLGTAATFAVLGGSAVTNTGATVLTGDLGVSPGSSISGFPPGQINGTRQSTPVSTTAQTDIATAIGAANAESCDANLSGQNLGGMTLPPGVYCFDSSAQLTGVLKLDAQGSPTAQWLFKVTSAVTTASNAAVILVNGAGTCSDNVNWLVGSSATVGSGSTFLGNIIATTSITMATGANSTGSLYAHTGAVTMDTNKISTCSGAIPPPPPLAISTTPSPTAPSGANISDTATMSGGLSPSGTVVFTLFGPGDSTCKGAAVSTTTGTLAGQTASSGNVTAGAPGTYNWVATYSGDANNATATSPCGSEQVVVTPPRTLTGRAYGLSVSSSLIGIPLVNIAPTPDTGAISTTTSSTTTTPCRAALTVPVTAHVLCASVTTAAGPGESDAAASVADASVPIAGIPTVVARAVQSTSTTTCAGSTGATTIAYLAVGGTVVIASPTSIPPNTGISVGGLTLVLNEQIPVTGPDAGLTVNAVHVAANALGLVTADVVIASSESDIGGCV